MLSYLLQATGVRSWRVGTHPQFELESRLVPYASAYHNRHKGIRHLLSCFLELWKSFVSKYAILLLTSRRRREHLGKRTKSLHNDRVTLNHGREIFF